MTTTFIRSDLHIEQRMCTQGTRAQTFYTDLFLSFVYCQARVHSVNSLFISEGHSCCLLFLIESYITWYFTCLVLVFLIWISVKHFNVSLQGYQISHYALSPSLKPNSVKRSHVFRSCNELLSKLFYRSLVALVCTMGLFLSQQFTMEIRHN